MTRTPWKTKPIVLALALLLTGPALAQGDTGRVTRFYDDALKRYERHDYAGAAIQLKNALQIDKNQLAVHLLLAKTLLANSEVANAEFEFGEALRLGVNRAEVVVPLAQSLVAQGKQAQIFDDSRLRLEDLPRGVQFQLLLVRSSAYVDLGDGRQAMEAINAARAINPNDTSTWLAEVPLRVRAGQFREAMAAVEQALRVNPASADGIYQKGSILHVQGQLPAALALYAQALKIDSGHVDARLAHAGILIDLGRDKEAAADVAELGSLTTSDPRVAYLRSVLAQRAGDAAAAKAAMQEITALLDPVPLEYVRYRVQTLMLNGMAHFGLGELEKAKPYLELAWRQQPSSPLAKLVAQIALAEPNVPRAIEVLEDYLRARPGDGQALLMLATAHMSQGRYAKAATLMTEALRAKDTPAFHTALGLSLMHSGQGRNATDELERAFKSDPKQTYAGLALVDAYMRTGRIAKAQAMADGLVRANPDNPGMLIVQAQTFVRAGNLAGARQGYEKALKLDGTLMPAKLGLAHVDALARNFAAADKRLRELLRDNDHNVDLLFELATLNELWGRDDEALKWLGSAVEASSGKQTTANFALVAWYLRKGPAAKALEAAKQLLSKIPNDVEALEAYAAAQLANGDAAGARSSLANAARRAAYDAPTLVDIGRAQLQASDLAGAAYSADKALSGNPDHLPAQVLMAQIELLQGAPDKSEKRAQSIIQANPNLPVGYELQADIALRRGQTSAAVAALRRAHAIENSTRSLLRLFGVMASMDGGKPAIDLGEAWLRNHPKDLVVFKAVGDAYARAGNSAQARRNYEAALKLSPTDVEALNNLASLMLLLKDPGASAMAEKALAQQPQNPLVMDTAGWAAWMGGNKDRALQLLRDARLRAPGIPEIRYHLAAALAQTGHKAEARDELNAGLATLKPGHTFRGEQEARQLLATLK
jgi:putative PEP-CTERM system TPR-repeat lipoprotein